ncbi:MAG: TIGR00730 family Rossman fold protein [Gemmataceae bacterium]
MQRLCVFCGSKSGDRAVYADAARHLGQELVRRGIGLVFGAGHVGLMGVLADAVLEAGGEAIGVIPEALVDRELAHNSLTELRVVATMHERKAMMFELSDAFMALPGGFGTLEELFEIVTWVQLGLHQKPVGLVNIDGFYDALLGTLDHMVREGFLKQRSRRMLLAADDPIRLLDLLDEPPAEQENWIEPKDL